MRSGSGATSWASWSSRRASGCSCSPCWGRGPPGSAWPLRTWCLGYAFYLFAALDPWTSLYRYLMLLFPLFVVLAGAGWAPGTGRDTPRWLLVVRTVVLAGLMIGWQVWWGWYLFRFEPPSDYPP